MRQTWDLPQHFSRHEHCLSYGCSWLTPLRHTGFAFTAAYSTFSCVTLSFANFMTLLSLNAPLVGSQSFETHFLTWRKTSTSLNGSIRHANLLWKQHFWLPILPNGIPTWTCLPSSLFYRCHPHQEQVGIHWTPAIQCWRVLDHHSNMVFWHELCWGIAHMVAHPFAGFKSFNKNIDAVHCPILEKGTFFYTTLFLLNTALPSLFFPANSSSDFLHSDTFREGILLQFGGGCTYLPLLSKIAPFTPASVGLYITTRLPAFEKAFTSVYICCFLFPTVVCISVLI